MSVTQFNPTRWEARDTETWRRQERGEETWRGGRGEKDKYTGRDMDVKEIWGGGEWNDKETWGERDRREKETCKVRATDAKETWAGREGGEKETWRHRERNGKETWEDRKRREKEAWRDQENGVERDNDENRKVKDDEDDEDETDDELAPLTPGPGEERRSRVGRLDWCHCRNCAKMSSEDDCRCCHEDEGVWSRILEDESSNSGTSAYSCVVTHPFFTSVCLNPYALQALHSRDAQLFGYEEQLPLHEKYRVTSYRAFVDYYHGQLEYEVECRHLPSCAASTIKAHFQDHAFIVRVPGYSPL